MSIICNPQRFYIDYRNFYATKDLLFVNSVGGIETIRLRGEVDAAADYVQTSAQKISTPEYFKNGILDGDNEDVLNTEQESFTGDTGFMGAENLDRLRDLFLACKEKRAFEITKGKLVPINIRSKTVQWYTNKQSLYSASIIWQYAYSNSYYSPAGLLATGGACPAVETFAAIQSGRDRLTITWALESGYDKIQIEIVTGLSSAFITLEGNSGQQEIPFTNLAPTNSTASVTCYAKTICNDQQSPPDLGPATSITITVKANAAPTAVSDYFTLAPGYTSSTTFKTSVLDNDYDANGDDFVCVAGSGSTVAGGTYAIDEEGIVTYTPPSASYTGTDIFPYSITELGTGALMGSANVFITVSAGTTNSTIYVKLSARNSNSTSQTSGTYTYFSAVNGIGQYITVTDYLLKYYKEMWLEFYSDAAGTTPADVTGIGLSVLVRKLNHSASGDVTTDTAYAPTGFEMKFFEGEYQEKYFYKPGGFLLSWQVLPGAGYTLI